MSDRPHSNLLATPSTSPNPPQQEVTSFAGIDSLLPQKPHTGPASSVSPIIQAVRAADSGEAFRLLQAGESPDAVAPSGEPALYLAVATCKVSLVRRLLESGARANVPAQHGDTPLHLAACRGYVSIVSLLLTHDADPNARHRVTGQTPLHYAAVKGQVQCVSLLLNYGADPELTDAQGYSSHAVAPPKVRVLMTTALLTTIEEEASIELTQPESEASADEGQFLAFLRQVKLEQYYEELRHAGFEDLDSLLEQMKTPMPLNSEMLARCGVARPGHQDVAGLQVAMDNAALV